MKAQPTTRQQPHYKQQQVEPHFSQPHGRREAGPSREGSSGKETNKTTQGYMPMLSKSKKPKIQQVQLQTTELEKQKEEVPANTRLKWYN